MAKVLIVDEDMAALWPTVGYISDAGHKVTHVSSPQQGLETLATNGGADIIFLGFQQSAARVAEFLLELRTNPAYIAVADIPCIGMDFPPGWQAKLQVKTDIPGIGMDSPLDLKAALQGNIQKMFLPAAYKTCIAKYCKH
jgi:CheY-like chemotaxis protein